MTKDRTVNERHSRWRERQREAGLTNVQVWIPIGREDELREIARRMREPRPEKPDPRIDQVRNLAGRIAKNVEVIRDVLIPNKRESTVRLELNNTVWLADEIREILK